MGTASVTWVQQVLHGYSKRYMGTATVTWAQQALHEVMRLTELCCQIFELFVRFSSYFE